MSLLLNGEKLVKITKYKNVSNNAFDGMETRFPSLYVVKRDLDNFNSDKKMYGDNNFFIDTAYIKVTSKMNSMMGGINLCLQLRPDEVNLVLAEDTRKPPNEKIEMLELWWD